MQKSDAVRIMTCAWLVGGCFNPMDGTSSGTASSSGATGDGSGTTRPVVTSTTVEPTTAGPPTTGETTTGEATTGETSTDGTTGAPALCGDAIVGPGEECDDGGLVDGDGCSSECALECGDGDKTGAEACDDGNQLDNDGCASDCVIELCGDMIVQSKEECDDGNLTPGDGCSAECNFEKCGNGITTAPEECDDGNEVDRDGCTDCLRDLVVFLSSETHDGKFGGTGGADARCTALAKAAMLPGTKYVALVASSPLDTPGKRLGKTARPYLLPTKVPVAVDKVALVGGTLLAAIDVDELGSKVVGPPGCDAGGLVWTGLNSSGGAALWNCGAWLAASPFPPGSAGSFGSVGTTRLATCDVGCNAKLRLYCAESI